MLSCGSGALHLLSLSGFYPGVKIFGEFEREGIPMSCAENELSAQAALSENYRRFLKGVESVMDYGIFMLDPNGYVTTWNEGAKRIQGYSGEEILGKHFSIFYTEETKHSHPAHSELDITKAQGRFEDEGWRIRKDGKLFWANVIITAVYEQESLLGFLMVARDLSERKKMEESLRQSEERFRLLVEGVKDYAIFMLDPHGFISTWNQGANQFKGYSAAEVIGKHFSIFYPQEAIDRKHPEYELKTAIEQGHFEEEGWRVRKNGELFWANVVITALFDKERKLIGFAKVTRDLTERKHVMDALEAAKNKAEAINKELETFAYSISHDLRAPLRTITAFTEIVIQDKSDQLDEEAKSHLERVSRNAHQMADLIGALLNLSRLSRTELRRESVNLSELVRGILNTLQEQEPNHPVAVVIQDNVLCEADPILIRAMLENLLGNAWKFSATKEAPRIEFGLQESESHDGKPVFYIRDNGAGFNMQNAAKLFGAFQRLHDAKEYPGTGIGLATVQRIIHRHGGTVWAEAAENEGAVFYFTL